MAEGSGSVLRVGGKRDAVCTCWGHTLDPRADPRLGCGQLWPDGRDPLGPSVSRGCSGSDSEAKELQEESQESQGPVFENTNLVLL